jgi:arsenate reductase (thioredoxin)
LDNLIHEKAKMSMSSKAQCFGFVGLILAVTATHANDLQKTGSWEKNSLKKYIEKATASRQTIPAERLEMLSTAASGIRKAIVDHGSVDLVFVCTHNSRRSQFSQVWAAIAAEHYKNTNVRSHSCGTETTACNARTVAALERAGMSASVSGNENNPLYSMVYDAKLPPVVLFSKAFGHASLPKENFVAMMCCDHADENCPVVSGAIQRVRLSYVDPKVSDDTSDEAKVYDERCFQIATEMLELMRMVSQDRQ